MNKQLKIAVIMLNWNGAEDSLACVSALDNQTLSHTLIAVDNGSSDNFTQKYIQTENHILLQNSSNLGFAGGVNTGIHYALEHGFDWIALLNNDAIPEEDWLEKLYNVTDFKSAGIITGKLLKTDGLIDSTGDVYTSWGLPYPRGRDTTDTGQYDKQESVFSGSGGASLYSSEMLRDIGLFDEDFFAYYEDVDISFRAQLAGWKVVYTPKAIAHHKVGASSGKVPGLTTYMTIKNLPWLFWKHVPMRLIPTVWPRFFVAHSAIIASSLAKGKIAPVFKGIIVSFILLPKKLIERRKIQKSRKVSDDYIKSLITYDLPPNAAKLRKIRRFLKI